MAEMVCGDVEKMGGRGGAGEEPLNAGGLQGQAGEAPNQISG